MELTKTLKNCEEQEIFNRAETGEEVIVSVKVGGSTGDGVVGVITGEGAHAIPTNDSKAIGTQGTFVRVHYQESGGPNEVPISYEVSK